MTATERKPRALLYGRVSVIRGQRAYSVDDQLAELRAWADREGWPVVGEHRDDDISASRYAKGKHRPGWHDTMAQITTLDEGDILMAWELSRATRDRAVWAALVAACEQGGVRIATGGRVHDLDDPDDGFNLDLKVGLAVREAGEISRRTRRGAAGRRTRGGAHGTHRYGYRSEYDAASGRLLRRVIDPDRAAIVREAADRALAGESCYSIARGFNERGITTSRGKRWRGGNLRTMLISPTYAGKTVHDGKVVGDASWEPILTDEEHHRLVALLTDPARTRNHEGTHVRHLLTGIAACGVCDGPVRVLTDRRKRPERQREYRCRDRFCISRQQDAVDEVVEAIVVAWLSRADVNALLSEAGEDETAKAAVAKAAELQARLNEFYDQAAEGKLSAAGLARVENKLLVEIRDAERRARPAALPGVVYQVVSGDDVAAAWKRLDVTEKRAIVKALFTVRILPAGSSAVTFDRELIEVARRAG